MNLFVYSICKNEINNIKTFVDSCFESDGLIIVDTGSNDGTREWLTDNNITWIDYPNKETFRFDEARNYAHSLIPSDVEIRLSLDVGDTISKGYSKIIKEYWIDKLTNLKIPITVNGKSGFSTINCHDKDCYWKYPVYELLTCDKDMYIRDCNEITINRFVTRNKEKLKTYLDLAKIGIEENPNDIFAQGIYEYIKKENEQWMEK